MIRRRTGWGASAAFVALVASACAVAPVASLAEFEQRSGDNSFEIVDRPLRGSEALVLDVPFDRQVSRTACGAHVLASVIRYWRMEAVVTGASLWAESPAADQTSGYTMAELLTLAGQHKLSAFGVRLDEAAIVAELERGRPVLVPVRAPSVYLQSFTLFDPDPIVIGQIKNLLLGRIGVMSELTGLEMLSHYLLVVGHAPERFVVLDPLLGYRTISRSRLASYRKSFDNAALVFSLAPEG